MPDLFSYRHDEHWPAGVPRDVAEKFEELALRVNARGWEHYSADAILHAIRWREHVERGNRSFKCNNNWTSSLARWFHKKHPNLNRFFETREKRAA